MPRSQNRRYLELPAALYATLKEIADAEQRTVAQIAADLIVDGQTVRDYLVPMQTEMREIRRELETLRFAIENRLPPWKLPVETQ
jgi:CopG-like RHH_1 or ribbon-helix-helix domain, RHH_5